ncbi:MAG: hypothetical protein AVDCRST_MAG78-427, partial [uncultured Rubrobacteraceae bacterium]
WRTKERSVSRRRSRSGGVRGCPPRRSRKTWAWTRPGCRAWSLCSAAKSLPWRNARLRRPRR